MLLVANPEQLVTWLGKIERQGPDMDSEQETMRVAISVFQTRTTRVHGLAWAYVVASRTGLRHHSLCWWPIAQPRRFNTFGFTSHGPRSHDIEGTVEHGDWTWTTGHTTWLLLLGKFSALAKLRGHSSLPYFPIPDLWSIDGEVIRPGSPNQMVRLP